MSKNKKARKKPYVFKDAMRIRPNSKKILGNFTTQITQLYQQGNVQEALSLSQQALKGYPNDLNLLQNAGAFAGILGRLELAETFMPKSAHRT